VRIELGSLVDKELTREVDEGVTKDEQQGEDGVEEEQSKIMLVFSAGVARVVPSEFVDLVRGQSEFGNGW
jgi:hypothetical protein